MACHDTVFEVHARRVRGMDVDRSSLTWEAAPAVSGHDIVRGSLKALGSPGGTLTSSVRECLARDVAADWLTYAPDPPPGEGYWFLLRDVEGSLEGSYDSGEAAQIGSADEALQSSPVACP
jgi:hypothetical protein